MGIRVMTMVQGEEDLLKVIPDGIFWDGSTVPLRLFDDGGEVAAAAIFHEDVENAGIAVDESVVVTYDVFVMQVFKDIPII